MNFNTPGVNLTCTSSSLSLRLIAIIPVFLGFEYSSRLVFFNKPFLVIIIRKCFSSKCLMGIIALILSSADKLNKLTIAFPVEYLDVEGSCQAFSQNIFPVFVKHNIVECVLQVKICSTASSSSRSEE